MKYNLFLSTSETAGSETISDTFDEIGELPALARTFSRVIEENRNNLDSAESIYLFRGALDVKNPSDARDFTDLEWNITFAIKSVMFNPAQNTQDISVEALEAKMYNVNERITKVCISEKIYDYNGLLVSGKISFKLHRPDDNTFISIDLWLNGQMFLDQYPETDMYIVPPVANLADLWLGHSEVAILLLDQPRHYMIDGINAITALYPNTASTIEILHYKPDSCQSHIDLEWVVVYYGKEPTKDQKRSAIIDYIRANSDRDIPDWADHIIPDLYIRSEFILIPMWDRVAITDDDGRPSMYSGFSDINSGIGGMSTSHSSYPEDHIKARSEVVSFSYRYLSAIACGSPANIEGYEDLSIIYQDYVPASSAIVDYSRMSTITKVWERFMDRLVRAADSGNDTLPGGVSIEIINNKQWAVAIHEGVRYVVLTRLQ